MMVRNSTNAVQPNATVAAALLPPATVDETGWDILLALHADTRCEISLSKLASLISVSLDALQRRLAALERGQLITGASHKHTGEIRAILTAAGRALLDSYLSATNGLQVATHH